MPSQPAPRTRAPALPPALAVSVGQHSDRGRKSVNQDFHGACIPARPHLGSKGIVLALADGIGSSQVSSVASEAAVRAVVEDYYCTSDAWSVKRSMQCVLAATNSWLHAQTQRSPWRHDHDRGYVCALSALVLKGRTAHLFHTGDVRVYLVRGAALEQLTEDHRVWVGGGRSHLSRALGFRPRLELDYRAVPIESGDLFVMACDGVYEHVQPRALVEAVRAHGGDLDRAARALVGHALERGSDDNLTVQLARVDALPEPDAPEARQLRAGLPPPPPLQPRATLDGYRIERELHASARSHVYLATDLESGERVVLKTPATDLAQDERALDRFALEEWIARRVRSAHVVQPRGRTRPPSHLYVALEYVDGCTLSQWMRDHARPDLETVRGIVEQVAKGLQAFHRMEMLHRDLRPENIMIDGTGTAKIIDFGSVRVAGVVDGAAPGAPDEILGTVQYTAPECFLGDPPTERSDLFSLGVIAYQLLSGRLPYGAKVSALRTRSAQRRLACASLLDDRRALPAWLDAVVHKAVHPVPLQRYETLSEFVHDLRRPDPARFAARRVPLVERHPLRFWQAVALLLALALLVQSGLLQGGSHDRPEPADQFSTPTRKSPT